MNDNEAVLPKSTPLKKLPRTRLKCRYRDEVRCVSISKLTRFGDFIARLNSDYGFEVALSYLDPAGEMDQIVLQSQNDLMELLEECEASVTSTVDVIVKKRTWNDDIEDSYEDTIPEQIETSQPDMFAAEMFFGHPELNLDLDETPITANRIHDDDKQLQVLSNTTNAPEQVETGGGNGIDTTSLPFELNQNPDPESVTTRLTHQPNRSKLRTNNTNINAIHSQHINRTNGRPIRYQKGDILGQGAFGTVYLGLNLDTGELIAIKQLNTTQNVGRKELLTLRHEVNMMCGITERGSLGTRPLKHKHIVRYLGTEQNESHLSIFLEYVPGGSIRSMLDRFGCLKESVVRIYTRQLLLGLEYLHWNQIAHRDIKGANILVTNNGTIRLADFGASKRISVTTGPIDLNESGSFEALSTGRGDQLKGTPLWMAPEVIKETSKDLSFWKKADVWSVGCTVLEMLTGMPPFSQYSNPVTAMYHIACVDEQPQYPSGISKGCASFLDLCFQRQPDNRPEVSQLVLHPWVANLAAVQVQHLQSGSEYPLLNKDAHRNMSLLSPSALSKQWIAQSVSFPLRPSTSGYASDRGRISKMIRMDQRFFHHGHEQEEEYQQDAIEVDESPLSPAITNTNDILVKSTGPITFVSDKGHIEDINALSSSSAKLPRMKQQRVLPPSRSDEALEIEVKGLSISIKSTGNIASKDDMHQGLQLLRSKEKYKQRFRQNRGRKISLDTAEVNVSELTDGDGTSLPSSLQSQQSQRTVELSTDTPVIAIPLIVDESEPSHEIKELVEPRLPQKISSRNGRGRRKKKSSTSRKRSVPFSSKTHGLSVDTNKYIHHHSNEELNSNNEISSSNRSPLRQPQHVLSPTSPIRLHKIVQQSPSSKLWLSSASASLSIEEGDSPTVKLVPVPCISKTGARQNAHIAGFLVDSSGMGGGRIKSGSSASGTKSATKSLTSSRKLVLSDSVGANHHRHHRRRSDTAATTKGNRHHSSASPSHSKLSSKSSTSLSSKSGQDVSLFVASPRSLRSIKHSNHPKRTLSARTTKSKLKVPTNYYSKKKTGVSSGSSSERSSKFIEKRDRSEHDPSALVSSSSANNRERGANSGRIFHAPSLKVSSVKNKRVYRSLSASEVRRNKAYPRKTQSITSNLPSSSSSSGRKSSHLSSPSSSTKTSSSIAFSPPPITPPGTSSIRRGSKTRRLKKSME
eukprot:g2146.t1